MARRVRFIFVGNPRNIFSFYDSEKSSVLGYGAIARVLLFTQQTLVTSNSAGFTLSPKFVLGVCAQRKSVWTKLLLSIIILRRRRNRGLVDIALWGRHVRCARSSSKRQTENQYKLPLQHSCMEITPNSRRHLNVCSAVYIYTFEIAVYRWMGEFDCELRVRSACR